MKSMVTILLCVVCLAACGSRNASRQKSTVSPPTPAALYGYKITRSYPHDVASYTQGLFWHEGALIESTGEYGASTLRRVELATGEPTQNIALDNKYFAEGAALVAGKIYQLTWLEGRCFVYDAATFRKTGEFTYKGEGWGLTTDGTLLYMSDGSANITVRDPATFAEKRTIAVRNAGRAVQNLNELEWIDGKIWANVYLTNQIVIIDPESGAVEGTIDFAGIFSHLEITPSTDVMNGIACDPATGRLFVTGKRWNKLFEVEVFKK